MRYYTPELLGRFASAEETIALAAQNELEKRSEQYAKHLKSIAKKLPRRFREMEKQFYLHDAKVVWPFLPWFAPIEMLPPPEWMQTVFGKTAREKNGQWPSAMLAVQLDAPPNELVILHYRGVRFEGTTFEPWHRLRIPSLLWLHDEVDLVRTDGQFEFLHSILFDHGVEIRIQFADFDFATLKPMIESDGLPRARQKTA
jgi:hypothetical protein